MKRFLLHTPSQAGATLVEVLVAIAISGIMLPALATALVSAHSGRPSAQQELKATALLHEAQEAVRSLREATWDNLSSDGTFHPVVSGNSWTLVSGSETLDGYTREIVIGPVARDSSGSIVSSGGTTDPSTRSVTCTVSWSTPGSGSSSITSTTYLTRWQQNTTWEQTTQADFTSGSLTNVVVTNNVDGEVQLNGAPGSYQPVGTYQSASFDAGTEVAWQALSFNVSTPGDSTLRFQVATNTDNHTWNYIGPDGTGGTYFTADSAIPLTDTDGRYIRYRAYFTATTGSSDTPVLSDVTLDYSR